MDRQKYSNVLVCYCTANWLNLNKFQPHNSQFKLNKRLANYQPAIMGYSRKKHNRGVGIFPQEVLDFLLYPWKFQAKQGFTPGNSTKLCYTPWNTLGLKLRPLENPRDFFSITPGNLMSFIINTWKIHLLFFNAPGGNSMYILNPTSPPFLQLRSLIKLNSIQVIFQSRTFTTSLTTFTSESFSSARKQK